MLRKIGRKLAESTLFTALVLLTTWAFAGYVWFVRPSWVYHPAYLPVTATLAVLLVGHLVYSLVQAHRQRQNAHKFNTIAEISSYDQLESVDAEIERHRHG